ncbi:MAG: hypothetical protein KC729_12750 [Candidatus Eisenbacteria bacterium]|uniref:DUF4402 domain-containing protein n=1 Tax=Eiseniibacteriota bacterium TaxID=2212470 RepID=A0A956RRF6_UNCEI|nr:hypothetical protein [Candidatus Eisenbacteria bacterium]
MKKLHSAGLLTALCAVGLALSGASCPLIPSIEEKVIELALGGSTTVPFEARGIINDKGQTECFDLADELDLNQILEDADVDSVTGIALAGVAYRVTKADPDPNRTISNTTVTISRDGGAQDVPLITNFSDTAGSEYDFKTAPLDPQGVALINEMLDDILIAVQNHTQANVGGCATWNGQSLPLSENTNFDWEIRIDITITGKISIDLPN